MPVTEFPFESRGGPTTAIPLAEMLQLKELIVCESKQTDEYVVFDKSKITLISRK